MSRFEVDDRTRRPGHRWPFRLRAAANGIAMEQRDWKADVDAIRSILMAKWDPIACGVPDDEYDAYIPVIYRLMKAETSIDELAVHLQEIETREIGLQARPEVNRQVAKMLLDLMQ